MGIYKAERTGSLATRRLKTRWGSLMWCLHSSKIVGCLRLREAVWGIETQIWGIILAGL